MNIPSFVLDVGVQNFWKRIALDLRIGWEKRQKSAPFSTCSCQEREFTNILHYMLVFSASRYEKHRQCRCWNEHFFLTMLRSSFQLWQSWSCAKVVIVRQLDKDRPVISNLETECKIWTPFLGPPNCFFLFATPKTGFLDPIFEANCLFLRTVTLKKGISESAYEQVLFFFSVDAAWLNEGRCPGGRPSVSVHKG